MSNWIYIVLIILGILACSGLSVFILGEFLNNVGTESEKATEKVKVAKIKEPRPERVARRSAFAFFFAHLFVRKKHNEPPTPEIVAAITASLSCMLGVPNYNIVIKDIRKGGAINA